MGVITKRAASTQYGYDWQLAPLTEDGNTWGVDRIQIILLQEIRDQLIQLNTLLSCPNFTGIPANIKAIKTELKKLPIRRVRKRR